MTSDLRVDARLVRQIVKASIDEALGRTRTPGLLAGTVDDIDQETLDVAYVRMDADAMSSDPTQSDNWGEPGVIPTTRLGETYVGEPVRVQFDGPAGASAMRTSAAKEIILPFGTEEGDRIRLDGNLGLISVGDDRTPGRRLQLDPAGGLRIHDHDDHLVAVLDEHSHSMRNPTTGLVNAEMGHGFLRLVDPTGTDDIEMVTTSLGTLPNPKFTGLAESNPGTSIVAPAAAIFPTTPADDYELYHAAAFLDGTSQAASWTPPAGTTERHDPGAHNAGTGTLSIGIAERDVATGVAGTFTSSQSNWTHGVGVHVVIRGGGLSSPAFRSIVGANFGPTTAAKLNVTLNKPSGVVEGDVMVAFVTLGNEAGSVPTGWTTPEGWVFLGATPLLFGPSTLATGIWVKLATASEPASYSVTITIGAGTKRLHAAVVAVQNPLTISGGAHIRMAGHPIRRLLMQNVLTAPNATLADFQNIPPGYDNLEVVYDGTTDLNGGSAAQRIRTRFNFDSTTGHYMTSILGANAVDSNDANSSRILLGGVGDTTGYPTGGSFHILRYDEAGSSRHVVLGHGYWRASAGNSGLRNEIYGGHYFPATNAAINRIGITVDAGVNRFETGSRAFLYGY
jgi:hypothetical protein